jgi:rhodanese-related sulfurtransferase
MKHISISTFKEVLQAEKNNNTVDFINVCTAAEYKEKHIEGVRSVPLDEISKHISEFKDKKTIYIHCRSGARGRKAIESLSSHGVTAELVNIEGGILAWEEAGHPTKFLTAKKLPLMRQVFLIAGLLVLVSSILGFTYHQNFFFVAMFVGAGLTVSGATGWCGMAIILAKMPWNK